MQNATHFVSQEGMVINMQRLIDLHIHTTASDGTYTPSNMIRLAKRAGLSAVAITDHDTVDGVDEAIKTANEIDIDFVPGVEISVGETDNIHILGLFINHKNDEMLKIMQKLEKNRLERNKKMIELLQKQGFDITYENVAKETGANIVGRMHIAKYIQKMGMVNDYRTVFRQYIVEGQSAYVAREKLAEEDGINAILNSGGVPVLAHINYFRKSDEEVEENVKRLKEKGLMGIEVYYSGYNRHIQELAFELAKKYDLLKSGGSDFHGRNRAGIYIGKGRGNLAVPYYYYEKIKKAAENK